MSRRVVCGFLNLLAVLLTVSGTYNSRTATGRVSNVEIITPTFVSPWPDPISMPYVQPVVDSAMNYLRNTYSEVFNVSHSYVMDPRFIGCSQLQDGVTDIVSRYVLRRRNVPDVTALISTACNEGIPENDLAREWNYLMITSAAAEKSTANRRLSPTWITTTISSMGNYLQLYLRLFVRYNWQSIFIILDTNTLSVFPAISDTLYGVLYASQQYSVSRVNVDSTDQQEKVDFGRALRDFRRVSRICVYLGNAKPLRDLLVQAAEKNMTNGEYVYIALEIFSDPVFGRYHWKYNDVNDNVAKNAFRSVLLLGMLQKSHESNNLTAIANDWPRLSHERYNLADLYYHKANPYLMGLYASFAMFGTVLNETLSSNVNAAPPTGKALAVRFLNRTFATEFGHIYIAETGLRRVDLTVAFVNSSTGEFQVAVVQHGEGWWWEYFSPIYWGSEVTPLNEPLCGYTNDRCLKTVFDPVILAAVPSLLVCVVLLALAVLWSHTHGKPGVADINWWLLSTDCFGRLKLEDHAYSE